MGSTKIRDVMLRVGVLTLGLGILATEGCTAEYHKASPSLAWGRSELVGPDKAAQLEKELTDVDLARMLDAQIKPKLPSPLAVARLNCGYSSASLAMIEQEELYGWQNAIRLSHGITEVRTISVGDGGKVTLKDLRRQAAQMGCEMLLVYLSASDEANNANASSILYWTIVGLFVVPGNDLEEKTIMQAMLVDTRTGTIFGTATGQGSAKESYIPAAEDIVRDRLQAAAPKQALAELQANAGQMITQATAASRPAPIPLAER